MKRRDRVYKFPAISIFFMVCLFLENAAATTVDKWVQEMIDVVNAAPGSRDAVRELCQRGGAVRRDGGRRCKNKTFAFLAERACRGVKGFKKSSCYKHISKHFTETYLTYSSRPFAEEAQKEGPIRKFICNVKHKNLEGPLKKAAEASRCPGVTEKKAFHAKRPYQIQVIKELEENQAILQKLSRALESREVKRILGRSFRTIRDELERMLKKVNSEIKATSKYELLSERRKGEVRKIRVQSSQFIKFLETKGIRVNPKTAVLEILDTKTKTWKRLR